MRTIAERDKTREYIAEETDGIVSAILELCRTIDDATGRIVRAIYDTGPTI